MNQSFGSISKYVLIIVGCLCALGSGLVLFGWIFSYKSVVSIHRSLGIMVFNTALTVFSIGVSEVFLGLRFKKIAQILLSITAFFCLMNWCQSVLDVNFGIDQLFYSYEFDYPMRHPGRMSLNSSSCLFLIAVSLFLFSLGGASLYIVLALILISISLLLSGVNFFGYITGIQSLEGWSSFAQMSVQTSAFTSFLAISIFCILTLECFELHVIRIAYSLGCSLFVLIASVIVWQASIFEDYVVIRKNAEQQIIYLKNMVEASYLVEIQLLQRMIDRFFIVGINNQLLLDKDIENYLRDVQALLHIQILNSDFEIIKEQNKESQMQFIPVSHQLSSELKQQLKFEKTAFIFDEKKKVFVLFMPMLEDHVLKLVLVTEFSSNIFIKNILDKVIFPNYLILFKYKDEVFFSGGDQSSSPFGAPVTMALNPHLLPWEIDLFITEATLILQASSPGFLFLGVGILFSVFCTVLIFIGMILYEKNRVIKDTLGELKISTEKAKEAMTAKGLFLANMSHEIRTPLNAVIGTVQLLNEMDVDEMQKKYFNRIEHASKTLLVLISDILDFSKIESGTVSLNHTTLSLEKSFQNVVQNMIAKVKAQKLDIFIDFPPQSFPLIKSDQYRLEQILSNFINNAIKFTKEGYVILRANPKIVSESQILVRIEVEDTGVGISEEDQKKLFGAFTQVHSTLSTQMGGVGLGLRICKKLIQMMGGEIGVISEKDKGTTFWVEIPFELGSSLEGTARNLSGNKVCLLDSKVKESELIAKYLQSWKVEVIQDASQARFVIASEENLSKAQESKLPILLISDFDLKDIPERVIACLSRPMIPSALFEIINTKLLNGKGES